MGSSTLRRLIFCGLLGAGVMWGQDAPATKPAASDPPASPAPKRKAAQQFPFPGDEPDTNPDAIPVDSSTHAAPAGGNAKPDLSPPRSDSVNAGALGRDIGESSSKSTQIDLSPPEDDARKHPQSSEVILESEAAAAGVTEFHSWDPHKAAKSVEVGDFYFKRKNYRAAEDRYREALAYKSNDAVATFRLAVCLEKLKRPAEAQTEYENYLKILSHGTEADEAEKALARLKKQ